MDEFEVDNENGQSFQDVPTEVLVTLAMNILAELERRIEELQSRKGKLKVVN